MVTTVYITVIIALLCNVLKGLTLFLTRCLAVKKDMAHVFSMRMLPQKRKAASKRSSSIRVTILAQLLPQNLERENLQTSRQPTLVRCHATIAQHLTQGLILLGTWVQAIHLEIYEQGIHCCPFFFLFFVCFFVNKVNNNKFTEITRFPSDPLLRTPRVRA